MLRRLIQTWRILNLPCEGMSALVSRRIDGAALSRTERFALQLHLLYCRACRRYRRQVESLRELLRQRAASLAEDRPTAAPQQNLSDTARARIQDRLRDAHR